MLDARYAEIVEVTRNQQPTTIRFVFYRVANAPGLLIPKSESGYRTVQQAILAMRRDGRIPWEWIVDTTRWVRKPRTWASMHDALASTAALYRRSLWDSSPTKVEVWCESEAIAGVLFPVTERWDVPLFPIHGQTSDTFVHEAANQHRGDPRQLVVYFFGDHDAHGAQISTSLEGKLRKYSGRDDIEFVRLACTHAQIDYFGDLPESIETKE